MKKSEYIQRETNKIVSSFQTKQEQNPITSKHFEMIGGAKIKERRKC